MNSHWLILSTILANIIVIFLSILVVLSAPSLAVMSKNQLRLIKFDSQFEDFETGFSLSEFTTEKSRGITHDWGSGNHCIYELERSYNYVPDEEEKTEMSRFIFKSVSQPADGSDSKVSISQNGSNLKIYVSDGPWENLFDLRCG